MAKKMQLVVFRLGKELFGADIASVQEIVRVPEITPVPDAPGFLEGVINLRGKIVPVLDLRRRLCLPAAARTKASRVLIAEKDEKVVGLLVDAASEVLRITSEEIEAPPEMISAIGVEYINGVAKIEERLVILLDFKKILSLEEMKKLNGVRPQVSVGVNEPLIAAGVTAARGFMEESLLRL